MGCKVTKNNTASIQYIERIFERWRGSRISGEKLLILKKGGGSLNAVFHMGGWLQKNLCTVALINSTSWGNSICLQTLRVGANDRSAHELQNEL